LGEDWVHDLTDGPFELTDAEFSMDGDQFTMWSTCCCFERSGQKSEVRSRRSEVRGRRAEVRGEKSEVRCPMSDVRSCHSERSEESLILGEGWREAVCSRQVGSSCSLVWHESH